MTEFAPVPERDEFLANKVIGAAIEVHRELGPGFLEGIYRKAMAYELASQGISANEEVEIFVPYKDTKIPGQRMDLIVADRIIVELKCVEELAPIHQSQLLSYLKSLNLRLGLLINFKTQAVRNGIKRVLR